MKPEQLEKIDFPEYYQKYIDLLPQEDLMHLLTSQSQEITAFIGNLNSNNLQHSYAEGKWTVGQVLQHMLDTERIFQYRALCIARGDKTSLPGYEQDDYVPASMADKRSAEDFQQEFKAVRQSGVLLFQSFNESMLSQRGTSNGKPLSAAAAGFIIAGHEKHHLNLFRTHYHL